MKPGTPEWAAKVTASKVAGILGLSPWASPLTTWLMMRGDLPADDGTNQEAKARGHYLESACLAWWVDQNYPTRRSIIANQVPHFLDDWAAATPDADAYNGDEYVLVDAKTTADYEWIEVPAHYVASSLWQLACEPAAARVHLAVLHGGLRFREYVVERDTPTIERMIATCRDFYESLQFDDPPELSGMVCEYEALRRVHTAIDKTGTVELSEALADAYLLDAAHTERYDATKARILDVMGTARLATCRGQVIARRQPSKGAVALVRVAAPTQLTHSPEQDQS